MTKGSPFSYAFVSPQGYKRAIVRIGGKQYEGKKLYAVQLRQFIKYDELGSQIHGSIKGRFQNWHPFDNDMVHNLFDACIEAKERMENNHQGYVVYRRVYSEYGTTIARDKVYDAKWGTDNRPYLALTDVGKQLLGSLAGLLPVSTPHLPALEYIHWKAGGVSPVALRY